MRIYSRTSQCSSWMPEIISGLSSFGGLFRFLQQRGTALARPAAKLLTRRRNAMRTYHRIASLAMSAGFTARLGLAVWFLIVALCATAQELHAANIIYVVGTCKGNSP